MVLSKQRRQTLNPKTRLRLSLTPAIRQSLQMMSWRNHQITPFIRDLAADNPFLDIRYPEPSKFHKTSSQADIPIDFPFSSAMAIDRPDISLHAHIMAEIGLLFPLGLARSVAMALVAHITPAGWLDDEAKHTAARYGIKGDAYQALLEQLQRIEPAGLFAQNLTECLALQLKDRGAYDDNMQQLLSFLPVLLDEGIDGLAHKIGLNPDQLEQLLKQIRQLDPKPGARFSIDDGDIFHPDLIITKTNDGYDVAVNASTLPSITVAADIKADKDMKPVLQKAKAEAAALQAALTARTNLLTALTGFAATRQSQFLASGDDKLVPLTMAESAQHLNCHPSTITRLVKDKLVVTPRGIIPLSHFFSPAITRPDGIAVASRAVTATIIALIMAEDKLAPLSDANIADAITAQHGITLTPRAIAKHRAKHHIAKAPNRKIKPRKSSPENQALKIKPKIMY
ncbi:MAG: hypothetical protein ISQ21_06730 [Alphaproteobacteria bacterium]|nr:hypothetical protein [Alphaproteobacteria bacterium]